MQKAYFKPVPGPTPLRASMARGVRFEECDQLGIMWHGRYASYFEDAREALGDKYGIGYETFKNARVALPVVSLHIDYRQPLVYRRKYLVEACIHWSDAVKLNIAYEIRSEEGYLATQGYSIQLMVDFQKNLLFEPPVFYAEFLRRWERGEVS